MDIIKYITPVFVFLVILEMWDSYRKNKNRYDLKDTFSNFALGTTQQLTNIYMVLGVGLVYGFVYDKFALFKIPEESIWSWVVLFFAVDFLYYWFHRSCHGINILWASHVPHHQSEEYNLSVAFRQGLLTNLVSALFFLPLVFLGYSFYMIYLVYSINLVYQFWVHTQYINKLGFLEWFMNTPSHHRAHHGINPRYIDKNHAGTLIIWDKMFGTFEPETEEVVYGITKPLQSWNPAWSNFHYWVEMFTTAVRTGRIRDKLKVWFMDPGWRPADLGGPQSAPPVDAKTFKKFKTTVSVGTIVYVLLHGLGISGMAMYLDNAGNLMQEWTGLLLACWVFLSAYSLGLLLEGASYGKIIELLRLAAFLPLLYLQQEAFMASWSQLAVQGGAVLIVLASMLKIMMGASDQKLQVAEESGSL